MTGNMQSDNVSSTKQIEDLRSNIIGNKKQHHENTKVLEAQVC